MMISSRKALACILGQIAPAGTESFPLRESAGRVLREQLHAEAPSPPFDRVMMDGVALPAAWWSAEQIYPILPSAADRRMPFHAKGNPDGLRITCEVTTVHRTGIEMEALTGVSVAALTIVDMCKALTPHILIECVRLLEKSGGKREVTAP